MQRDLTQLEQTHFDLVIIGGGIYGVACAWEATLRGLKVLLLEQNDFGNASSANSAKIAHSGLRYLQHADIKRLRESVRERNLLVRNAPHLVNSQPFLFPIYGHGIKGKEVMSLYMKIYDLLSPDRKAFKDPARRIGDSTIISKEEVLKLAPNVEEKNLTGGAIWFEGQIHNTERMLMALIRGAADKGAQFINYMKVTGLKVENSTACGVTAQDHFSHASFTISADNIINASGPWLEQTRKLTGNTSKKQFVHGSKAFSLLTRSLCDGHALSFGIRPMYNDKKAVIDKGSSIQFAIPWRGLSLIGSLHLNCDDDPQHVGISEQEIQTYLDRINEGLPKAKLKREDIKHILWGMIPAEEAGSAAPEKHYQLIDHSKEDNIDNFLSIMGVKFTTSRDVAKKAIDLLDKKSKLTLPASISHQTPVWGGDIKYLDDFMEGGLADLTSTFSPAIATRLLKTYGSQYQSVLNYNQQDPKWLEPINDTEVLKVEIIHAIKAEQALKLSDVIFRRTDLGSLQYPGAVAVQEVADIMAQQLQWDNHTRQKEIDEVTAAYAQYWPSVLAAESSQQTRSSIDEAAITDTILKPQEN